MKKFYCIISFIILASAAIFGCGGSSINVPNWAKGTWGTDGKKALEVTNNAFIITASGQSADWVKYGEVNASVDNNVYTFSVLMKGQPSPTTVTLTKIDDKTILAKGHHWGTDGVEMKKM